MINYDIYIYFMTYLSSAIIILHSVLSIFHHNVHYSIIRRYIVHILNSHLVFSSKIQSCCVYSCTSRLILTLCDANYTTAHFRRIPLGCPPLKCLLESAPRVHRPHLRAAFKWAASVPLSGIYLALHILLVLLLLLL